MENNPVNKAPSKYELLPSATGTLKLDKLLILCEKHQKIAYTVSSNPTCMGFAAQCRHDCKT